MYHDFNYQDVLSASLKGAWVLDDVLREDEELDFSRNFLPASLARTHALTQLAPDEQMLLNQIGAHEYLCIFGLVEEFILPFLLDHARPALRDDDWRVRALLNFAGEEAKHIQLFKRFHAAFVRGFPIQPKIIGPSEAIAAEVLKHDPLSIALVILMIEWMTQQHYLGSIKDDGDIDPLFKRLMRFHWIEEAQHAKLDTLIVEALAEGRSETELDRAIDGFFAIGEFLDAGLQTQAAFNLDALEAVLNRTLPDKQALAAQQGQAARWTYLGSGMVHERFHASLAKMSPSALRRVVDAAPRFA